MKACLAAGCLAGLFAHSSARAELYYYRDENNQIHATDSPDMIPERYRKKAKMLAGRKKTTPSQKGARAVVKIALEDGRKIIHVKIGSKEARFVYSPAALNTIVAAGITKAAGIEEFPKEPLQIGSNLPKVQHGVVPIEIEGLISAQPVFVIDEHPDFHGADGILGQSTLSDFDITESDGGTQLTLKKK